MFFGKFLHQIDDRGRLRIPPTFKDELGKNFYFVCGAPGVINVFPREVIEDQFETLFENMSIFDADDEEALIDYSKRISGAIEDKQGRVTLPKEFLDFANLKKGICTIGVGKYISIMSSDYKPSSNKTYSDTLAHINKKLEKK